MPVARASCDHKTSPPEASCDRKTSPPEASCDRQITPPEASCDRKTSPWEKLPPTVIEINDILCDLAPGPHIVFISMVWSDKTGALVDIPQKFYQTCL